MPSSFGHVLGIWIAHPDERMPWGRHHPLVLPREGMWDERQTGAGTVPFECAKGWLEIYHGVNADMRYALGAVLLDRTDPCTVLGRSPEPILLPERSYEHAGLLSDVLTHPAPRCRRSPELGHRRRLRGFERFVVR